MGMTIEEAIKHGQEQLEIFGGEHREFIKLAIKALEQGSILDKINYEISHLPFRPYEGRDTLDRKEVLAILDKHKAEQEET